MWPVADLQPDSAFENSNDDWNAIHNLTEYSSWHKMQKTAMKIYTKILFRWKDPQETNNLDFLYDIAKTNLSTPGFPYSRIYNFHFVFARIAKAAITAVKLKSKFTSRWAAHEQAKTETWPWHSVFASRHTSSGLKLINGIFLATWLPRNCAGSPTRASATQPNPRRGFLVPHHRRENFPQEVNDRQVLGLP